LGLDSFSCHGDSTPQSGCGFRASLLAVEFYLNAVVGAFEREIDRVAGLRQPGL
jgi:hypothetical protein